MSSRPTGDARAAFERFLRWTVEVEYPAHASFLPPGTREAFADYYRRLPPPGDERAIRRMVRGAWRGDVGWTARWIAARERPRVLDAGSGFGTFAMLYAAMGAEVRLLETDYSRCVGDGIGVAQELYALHGLPWTREGEAAMRRWDVDNPRHKLGSYGYSLEDYGWSEDKIEAAFGPVAQEWRGK